MLKIFGCLDIFSGIILALSILTKIPAILVIFISLYLVGKGVLFLATSEFNLFSIVNLIDILIGIMFYFSISFDLPGFIFLLSSLFLLQKGAFSVFPTG